MALLHQRASALFDEIVQQMDSGDLDVTEHHRVMAETWKFLIVIASKDRALGWEALQEAFERLQAHVREEAT